MTQGEIKEEARENLVDAVSLMRESIDLSKLPESQVAVEEIGV
jgi:hypothetical protein